LLFSIGGKWRLLHIHGDFRSEWRRLMIEAIERTPGIWMTEQQCMQMLDELRIAHVFKPEGGKMMLTVSGRAGGETLTVSEFKARSAATLAELEDRKRDIADNAFASMMDGRLPTGGERSLQVKYLKRDDQLTPEEEIEKRRLLREISREMSHHRTVVGAMNYLQIHFKELEPKLARREVPLGDTVHRVDGVKLRWTKGIKSAALFCLKESQKEGNTAKTPLDLCREFLAHYSIDGEEDYTPEQLFGNMQQIVQLDRAR
jgi:hypothetical protein